MLRAAAEHALMHLSTSRNLSSSPHQYRTLCMPQNLPRSAIVGLCDQSFHLSARDGRLHSSTLCAPSQVAGSRAHNTHHSRVSAKAPLKEEEDWIISNQDAIRAAPLIAGGLGVVGVVLSRSFSGVVGLDASSAESRTDLLIIVLSAVLLLTGLQWLALKPIVKEPVALEGKLVDYQHSALSDSAAQELEWAWRALQASRCRALVVFLKGTCIFHQGMANEAASPVTSKAGPICRMNIEKGQGNYLANLALYPGRFEFTSYLPPNTQAVVIQPIGQNGALVAATDTQRGFGNLDRAWMALIADKIDSSMEGFQPFGGEIPAAAAPGFRAGQK